MVKQVLDTLWLAAAALVTLPRRLGKPKIPELGRGLPQDAINGRKAFDARVQQAFPVGSQVETMVGTLRDQSFEEASAPPKVDQVRLPNDHHAMTYRNGGFPAHTLWSVRWREKEGTITEIWGVFGHVGP